MSAAGELSEEDASEIARLAAVASGNDAAEELTERVVALAVRRVPRCTAAALTLAGEGRGYTFAASDPRIEALHEAQFDADDGPVIETLRYAEPRRMDDAATEARWAAYTAAAAEVNLATCLVLPVRTDARPVGALALYAEQSGVFIGAAHDVPLLLAAQTGVAVHNTSAYSDARQLIGHLQQALVTRSWIEQAKVIVATDHGLTPDQAFQLLVQQSQNEQRKLWELAREQVERRFGTPSADGSSPEPTST